MRRVDLSVGCCSFQTDNLAYLVYQFFFKFVICRIFVTYLPVRNVDKKVNWAYLLGSVYAEAPFSSVTDRASLKPVHFGLDTCTVPRCKHPQHEVGACDQTHRNHEEYVMRPILIGILN